MLATQSVRDQLQRYADGLLTPSALEEWLASETWDMKRWAPRGLQRLVASIHASLIEHNDGRLSDADLDRILRDKLIQLQRAALVKTAIEIEQAVARFNAVALEKGVAMSQAAVMPEPVLA